MQVPLALRERIRELAARLPESELRRASQRLTEAYKADGTTTLRTEAEQNAYLWVRLPATYGAVRTALEETNRRVADFLPRTILDLGSGPGTALWAAREVFPSIEQIHAVEREESLVRLSKKLLEGENGPKHEIRWTVADLRSWRPDRKYDLVIGSYSLGELQREEREALIRQIWEAAGEAFVVVEPGDRRGFESVLQARTQFVALGAEIAAPCPHALACPMHVAGNWCHFSVRVERTAEHRRLKGGELGYEDEKFSYVVASRNAARPSVARVVRHPLRLSGHTKLQLCTAEGLTERIITRSMKELHRKAKRADWGSGWEE